MTEAEGEGRPWCWAEWMGKLLHPEAAGEDGGEGSAKVDGHH